MANGSVQDLAASDYLDKFSRPLSVSAMSKLRQFGFLQELGYNGQLDSMKKDFHGLKEFNTHMDMYSNTNGILKIAWAIIKNLVPKNLFIEALILPLGQLGRVGKLFLQIPTFGQVFGASPDQLSPPSLASKLSSPSLPKLL